MAINSSRIKKLVAVFRGLDPDPVPPAPPKAVLFMPDSGDLDGPRDPGRFHGLRLFDVDHLEKLMTNGVGHEEALHLAADAFDAGERDGDPERDDEEQPPEIDAENDDDLP